MTTRILPPAEYSRLSGTELEAVWPHLRAGALVLVVEDDAGAVVGCWAFWRQWHAEGCWTAPSHRGHGGVTRALVRGMRDLSQQYGIRTIVTGCLSPIVARLLAHWSATKLPGDLYVFHPEGH